MEQFGLLRIQFDKFADDGFDIAKQELLGSRYNLLASDTSAPGVTHCVSAVRYLIQRTSGYRLPLMYVGDMCRDILDRGFPSGRIIPLSEGDRGDLIFFRGRSRISCFPAITHVGVLVDSENFFHSTYGRGGVIDPIDTRIKDGSIATCRILSSHTDERRGLGTTQGSLPITLLTNS